MKCVMLPTDLKSPDDIDPNTSYVVMPKIDGIRFRKVKGCLVSRTNKPLPNKHIQSMYSGLDEGIEGELVYGDEYGQNFDKTSSIVMSKDKDPSGIVAIIFDWFDPLRDEGVTYDLRFLRYASDLAYRIDRDNLEARIVAHRILEGMDLITEIKDDALTPASAEGSIIRRLDSTYKQGRATAREGTFFKVKKHKDEEALVVDIIQLMSNQNEPIVDERGRSKRPTHKEGMVPMHKVGALRVMNERGSFKVGSGLTEVLREEYYKDPSKIIGKYVKFKYYELTSKGTPRHPVYLGVRDTIDFKSE